MALEQEFTKVKFVQLLLNAFGLSFSTLLGIIIIARPWKSYNIQENAQVDIILNYFALYYSLEFMSLKCLVMTFKLTRRINMFLNVFKWNNKNRDTGHGYLFAIGKPFIELMVSLLLLLLFYFIIFQFYKSAIS